MIKFKLYDHYMTGSHMHACMHVHTHTCMHTHAHAHTHTHTNPSVFIEGLTDMSTVSRNFIVGGWLVFSGLWCRDLFNH